MNDDEYYKDDDYRDAYYQSSQGMTREEKFWFVGILLVFMFVAVAMACGGFFFF
jgi:hypothetical protein